nr:MAG TPA: hypothetical protein [Caudoviricetes sp.]
MDHSSYPASIAQRQGRRKARIPTVGPQTSHGAYRTQP